ncbi:CcdB family protein [Sphingomonas sp.]|uniref:CcdB family protein n=1 Tax=Sphingomonas sp. TaxID=28214 RepID=UPI0035BBFD81
MARLDVRRGRATGKLFLEVQADRFSYLKTRLVVPLSLEEDVPDRAGALHPSMVVRGEAMVLVTHLAVAVPVGDLGEVVATLADDDYRIVTALDTLIGTA